MDAIKFLKEAQRMCDYYTESNCGGCPNEIYQKGCSGGILEPEDIEINVERVEKWSAEHRLKTRAEVFLKLFPNSECTFCPQLIDDYLYQCSHVCDKCMDDYWNAPAPNGYGRMNE